MALIFQYSNLHLNLILSQYFNLKIIEYFGNKREIRIKNIKKILDV